MQPIELLSDFHFDGLNAVPLNFQARTGYSCELCGEYFKSLTGLKDHMVSAYGIQPDLEQFLDLSLGIDNEPDTPNSLDSVSTTASDFDKPSVVIQCPKCKKECRNYKGLRQHLAKIHQNRKKPVSCSECGKGFKHKHALKFHTRQVHEKSTRVVCGDCGKEVYNKYMLNKHRLVCQGAL